MKTTTKLKKKKVRNMTAETTLAILEARLNLCIACDQHDSGCCRLLVDKELAEYAKLAASGCPLKKW